MKQIDTGGLSFQELVDEDFYLVDKSLLIADILGTNPRGVYLYTRPRRFGKSTNITMLDAFFNIDYAGNTWFDDLDISGYPEYDVHRNAYPVIRLDLKDVVADDYEEFLGAMRTMIVSEFDRFPFIREDGFMTPSEEHLYMSLSDDTAPENKVWTSVSRLMSMLKRHYDRNVVVLIDEYDRAVTDSFGTDLMGRIISSLGRFFSSTLKSNRDLQLAYVTGVTQLAKAGVFSGLNNLTVDNVLAKKSDERFGFTSVEVRELLAYYGHPERFDEVKDWYDGYRFGDAEVYNPYSVMCYVQNGFEPKSYWMGTSRDNPLRWMLKGADTGDDSGFATLLAGSSITSLLHETMSYEDLRLSREKDLYSFMVMTGYLKAVPRGGGMYELSIPNGEVTETMVRMVAENVSIDVRLFPSFCAAVLDGVSAEMESTLGRILEGSSYMTHGKEFPYEVMLLTIMRGMLKDYDVRIEREAGNGRADIILTPERAGIVPMIFELKTADSEGLLDSEAEGAIAQIHAKRYYLGMKGKVVLIGIAFWGKVPRVRSEVLHLRRGFRDEWTHPADELGFSIHPSPNLP